MHRIFQNSTYQYFIYPYFASIEGWANILICMHQIFQKVPDSTFCICPSTFFWPICSTKSMHTDFVVHTKWIIFWLNRGVRVYFELYATYFHFFLFLLLQNGHIFLKHLKPCFLTSFVLFGKSAVYKSKYTLKPLLSQNMVQFTWITKSVCLYLFYLFNWAED